MRFVLVKCECGLVLVALLLQHDCSSELQGCWAMMLRRRLEQERFLRHAGLMCDEGLTLGNLVWTLQTSFTRLGLEKLRFKP